jgi:hypothetical protein
MIKNKELCYLSHQQFTITPKYRQVKAETSQVEEVEETVEIWQKCCKKENNVVN